MILNKKILAIIPARGGSKRLPQKNIKTMVGHPLISYTINSAKKSKYINRIIVSTDDKNIAEISKKYGAEVFIRPKYLAGDKIKIAKVILNLLEVLKKERYYPEIVVLLQPTSPLRSSGDIDNAVIIFLKNSCETVMSVCTANSPIYRSLKLKRQYLKPVLGQKYVLARSQNLPKIYIANGAIYISTPKIIKKYQSVYTSKILPYFMPEEKSIDIDDELDFKKAEKLMNKKNGIKK